MDRLCDGIHHTDVTGYTWTEIKKRGTSPDNKQYGSFVHKLHGLARKYSWSPEKVVAEITAEIARFSGQLNLSILQLVAEEACQRRGHAG